MIEASSKYVKTMSYESILHLKNILYRTPFPIKFAEELQKAIIADDQTLTYLVLKDIVYLKGSIVVKTIADDLSISHSSFINNVKSIEISIESLGEDCTLIKVSDLINDIFVSLKIYESYISATVHREGYKDFEIFSIDISEAEHQIVLNNIDIFNNTMEHVEEIEIITKIKIKKDKS